MLDFIDLKEKKPIKQIELEQKNSTLESRLDEMDSALFELLMKESGETV